MPRQTLTTQAPITRTSASGGVGGGGGGGGPTPWTVGVITSPATVAVSSRWLLTADLNNHSFISVTDPGGTLTSGMQIYLVGTLNSTGTEIASAAIAYGTIGTVTVYTGALQTTFRYLLGSVGSSDPTAPGFEFTLSGVTYHYYPRCSSTLRIVAMVIDSKMALYPRPA